VWSVLYWMAVGFATLGEIDVAAGLSGAIGDRTLQFVGPRRRQLLQASLADACSDDARAQLEHAGESWDAPTALAAASERIDLLAARRATEDVGQAVEDEGLTARQHEIAELVARGLTNKQIAQRLGISRYTAETHVRNILERLGAASRSEIATWFTRRSSVDAGTRSGT
jgi:DNA-binding CsgD family transcriptional regulator